MPDLAGATGAAVADELLTLVPTAKVRAARVLRHVGGRLLDTPSELDGWTRRTVLSHLRGVAVEFDRLLHGWRRGERLVMYDGLPARRRATLEWGDGLPTVQVLDGVAHAVHQLDRSLHALEPEASTSVAGVDAGGPFSVGQLIVRWCTEVEVHGSDLRVGLSPDAWDETWVRLALPRRVADLGHSRARHPESHAVDGGFQLLVTDLDLAWYVTADGPEVVVEPGTDMLGDLDLSQVVSGTANHVLRLLLGRTAPETFGPAWRTAAKLRAAFPGP